MVLTQGQRLKLSDLFPHNQFEFVAEIQGIEADCAVFGLNSNGKLLNDDYMIFYNQTHSPCGGIILNKITPHGTYFNIDLTKLNSEIDKLVLVASSDNNVFSNITYAGVSIYDDILGGGDFALTRDMFTTEKAVMIIEIYKKDNIWRFSALAQGFAGGLEKVVEYFGAKVADTPSQSINSNPTPNNAITVSGLSQVDLKKKVSLEKAQKTGDASIIDLTKKSLVSLEKKNLLDVKARVALVLDASGSMNWQYNNGDVQRIVDRVMPLAISFDDDSSFECWAFAEYPTRLPDVNINNVKGYIVNTAKGHKSWKVGARINEEVRVIEDVINYYRQYNDNIPCYVIFISDGGVGSSRQMQRILTDAAFLPIFWQFVGVGGRDYGILEKLDDMTGRIVDNCNFFSVDGITHISDEELYDALLDEFPQWIQLAKNKHILR